MPRKKSSKQNKKLQGIYGFLLVVFLFYICSLLSVVYLLTQRAIAILAGSAAPGVYLTMALSLLYLFFLVYSVILMISMKKEFVKTSITALSIGVFFSLWLNIIGYLLFAVKVPSSVLISNVTSFIVDILVAIFLIKYLKKSSRVKNTFVR